MPENFDFVVVGGGSAGAVIASRLTEDPLCRVALIEAGERPPAVSSMPVACAAMQLNPETDWMYTADPGKAGLGLNGRRMPVPRGKMLGGSSSINYMMYVRGHPGDFDAWAEGGATGWSYNAPTSRAARAGIQGRDGQSSVPGGQLCRQCTEARRVRWHFAVGTKLRQVHHQHPSRH